MGNQVNQNRSSQDQPNWSYQEQANLDYNGDTYRGRGRGGRSNYYRGRGRRRFNVGRNAMRITCYQCDKIGHFVAQCPELKLKLQEAQETETLRWKKLMNLWCMKKYFERKECSPWEIWDKY